MNDSQVTPARSDIADSVREELAAAVARDQSNLGDVWRRTQAGQSAEAIQAALGTERSNFVWNYRRSARAVVDGDLPTAPTVAAQAASHARRILKDEALTGDARTVLQERLGELDELAASQDQDLAALLEEVLILQESWTKDNSHEMRRRGWIIRRGIPGALGQILPPSSSLPFAVSIEGQDGQGLKAKVPWVRVYSKEKSPRAGIGWYVVFLFAADGSALYLSLATGVTEMVGNGRWRLRSNEWISSQVASARSLTASFIDDRMTESISLADPGIGAQYEAATAFATRYPRESLPSTEDVQADLETLLSALSRLYSAQPAAQPVAPGEPEELFQEAPHLDRPWLEARTFWSGAALDEVLGALESKSPQVVLTGPPGTGKSWVAQAIARYLTQDDHRRWRLVQFHPSYGYESFVEGLRPKVIDGAVSFDLIPGSLLRMAEAARLDPKPHVLILDEMNRANVPRVLGELMFLFEYRDQMIDLQYSAGFSLPKNLLFIATMNTADRSIRSIDTALRRRFEVFECLPSVEILDRFYALEDVTNQVPDLQSGFVQLNDKLSTQLDKHHTIGHTFFMATKMDAPRLRRVWARKVYPLIEEYFFDLPDLASEYTRERFWPSTQS